MLEDRDNNKWKREVDKHIEKDKEKKTNFQKNN